MKLDKGVPIEAIINARWQVHAVELGDTVAVCLSVNHPRHGELTFLLTPAAFKSLAEQCQEFSKALNDPNTPSPANLH